MSPTSCVVRLNPRIMRCADDAILVLNAGSSSMKLAVFAGRSGELALELRGAVDGLYTMPCFQAHDPTGRVIAEKSWGRTALGHEGLMGVTRADVSLRAKEAVVTFDPEAVTGPADDRDDRSSRVSRDAQGFSAFGNAAAGALKQRL